MGKKWTKAQHAKFKATMEAKRNGAERTAKKFYRPEKVAAIIGVTMPRAVDGVIAKWSREADETFAALPFEKKAVLLGWLEKR